VRNPTWGYHGIDALCSASTAAVKTELSDEKELSELHANGAHGKMELPTRRSCPRDTLSLLSDENELPESHADGAHDEAELPNETELPNRAAR